ncbi:glutathione S-transferase N-terminal domain-containing protein [Sorangium sp. So ce296]
MGKLPLLVDGGTVVTESAAIGLYLADRYAPGRLAPKLERDDGIGHLWP